MFHLKINSALGSLLNIVDPENLNVLFPRLSFTLVCVDRLFVLYYKNDDF